MGLSCEERARHVRPGPACVAAFLSCCHLAENLTQQAREEQLFLGTSEHSSESKGKWGTDNHRISSPPPSDGKG